MHKKKIYLLIFLLFTTNIFAENSIPFLAFGNLYLQIEPCGCQPLTDRGGIRRIATLIEKIRQDKPKTLTLDLGNNFKNELIDESDTFHLKQALDLINPDVSLVNTVELQNLAKTLGKRRYVLSNSTENLRKKFKNIHLEILINETIIFGFLESNSSDLRLDIKKLLPQWKQAIVQKKAKKVVLLFSGSDKKLKALHQTKIFDLIISANIKKNDDKEIYEEQDKNHLLLRQFDSFSVKMVPMLGRGVLTHQVTTLEKSIFEKTTFPIQHQTSSSFQAKPKITFIPKVSVYWLDKSYDLGSPLNAYLKAYQKYKRNIFDQLAKVRKMQLAKSPFAGALACKNCHQKAYVIWKNSRHAKAHSTLEQKNKTKDSSCITCHVLGWNEQGGFVSDQDSPHFKNVQCENCHGAAKQHSQDPRVKPKTLAFNSCISCHNVSHSPTFNQKMYWKKIAH